MRTALTAVMVALSAAVPGSRGRADAPCATDAAQVCPGLPAGGGRLWACLLRNQFRLSSPCQQSLAEVQRRASEFNADCAGDVYRFCPTTRAGGGRILECLSGYVGRGELSTNCEEAVDTALERLQGFAEGCARDAAQLCPGVPPGEGRQFACLRSQSRSLSSACKRAVGQ